MKKYIKSSYFEEADETSGFVQLIKLRLFRFSSLISFICTVDQLFYVSTLNSMEYCFFAENRNGFGKCH